MAQRTYALSILAFFCVVFTSQANRCDNLYAKVAYSLNHAKKGMTATNFEHQMYFAERALEALEKSKQYQEECGCAKSGDKTLDAMETLEKAIEPYDWEAGRFFTKKSIAQIHELITALDECTQNDPADVIVEDSEETTIENEAYKASETDDNTEFEQQMVKVFDDHANARLDSARKAVEKLVLLSKTLNPHSNDSDNPDGLVAHQKAYLQEAKKILEQGLEDLNRK
ncbi:hypothetical protein [Flagellimonas allohymeniacidonis]|uniref:Uncharacterized protein n=1 Tax=Flagellimonas allohymeniacidonis TaxID=2517819 RepID=A0A4Q8QHB3_9FLAO|nr:hypothetical protein [Allomuricauda hymeniacidonis]TAI48658.1 hypothetical protein EW142_02335 [Allomuricauda hymeniacidonis]